MRELTIVICALAVFSSACGDSLRSLGPSSTLSSANETSTGRPIALNTTMSEWKVVVLDTNRFAGGTAVTAKTIVGSVPVMDPVLTFCRFTATGVVPDSCDSEVTNGGSQTFRISGEGRIEGYLTSGVPDVATLPRGAIAYTSVD